MSKQPLSPPRPGSTTLLQVAAQAGVSTATVNRVLRGGYVSKEARLKVTRALEHTGYRPNIIARGLRTSRSYSIGHIVSDITANPFFSVVARGFEAAAQAEGFSTILVDHAGNPEREMAAVLSFIQRRVDAIAFNVALNHTAVELAMENDIPVVEVERMTTPGANFVRVDNLVGARRAMQHLLELGHHRIAFIGGDPKLYPKDVGRNRSVEDDRLEAYRRSLQQAGIRLDPRLTKIGLYVGTGERGPGGEGYKHMRSILALPDRPTAVFATCDILAAGALQAIYEEGLRVPDDISIVGFDDTLAANLTPQLTTVAQPMIELGEAAFTLALAQISNKPATGPTVLETSLKLRASTAAPR